MASRSTDAAVAELSEAIELNPSMAFAHAILGCTYGYAGMAADGLHHCALATKLSPRAYFQPATLSVTGLCHLMARRFAEAVEFERRAVELRPDFGMAWRTLAAAAGLAGELELARGALAEAQAAASVALGRVGREVPRHRPRGGSRDVYRRPARRRARMRAQGRRRAACSRIRAAKASGAVPARSASRVRAAWDFGARPPIGGSVSRLVGKA